MAIKRKNVIAEKAEELELIVSLCGPMTLEEAAQSVRTTPLGAKNLINYSPRLTIKEDGLVWPIK
jgi:hypothetical protein